MPTGQVFKHDYHMFHYEPVTPNPQEPPSIRLVDAPMARDAIHSGFWCGTACGTPIPCNAGKSSIDY